MITEDSVIHWMRTRINAGQFESAASLARDFLEEHRIHDPLCSDFMCVINAGFKLAPEMANPRPIA